MADDKSDRGPLDRSRINVSEDDELRYWSAKWGVTPNILRATVGKVGVSVDAVAKELGKTV